MLWEIQVSPEAGVSNAALAIAVSSSYSLRVNFLRRCTGFICYGSQHVRQAFLGRTKWLTGLSTFFNLLYCCRLLKAFHQNCTLLKQMDMTAVCFSIYVFLFVDTPEINPPFPGDFLCACIFPLETLKRHHKPKWT